MKEDELHEMIARIDERTLNIATDLHTINGRLDAHAGKIRALELWRSALAGGGAVILGLLGIKH